MRRQKALRRDGMPTLEFKPSPENDVHITKTLCGTSEKVVVREILAALLYFRLDHVAAQSGDFDFLCVFVSAFKKASTRNFQERRIA
jgi:hypothetical protein